MDIRRTPGMQLISDRTGEVIYTPPEDEALLRDLLANRERFLQEQADPDPLVRMAVAETSLWTTRKMAVIRKLVEHTTERMRTRLPKTSTREFVDVIFEQPY